MPLAGFLVLRQALSNATGALAISDAIPLVWLIAFGIWRRRVEPVGLVAVVVFALAIVLTIALGGSALPLELRRSVFPGAVGLACLLSVAVGRPLLSVAAAKLGDARPQQMAEPRGKLQTRDTHKTLTVLTAICGITGVADAAAQIVLALTVSTTTFAEAARIASYTIIGGGLAVCAVYLRLVRASSH